MREDAPCQVLLVEDDPGDAHLVRQALREAGAERFAITWVQNLAEARQKLLESPPDVLLLDLSLPDSIGLDTVTAARQAAGSLPLIVLTGHDDVDFDLQTLESGAQDYLVKGNFTSDGLIRAIRYAISRARQEQRLQDSEERWRFALEGSGDGMWDWDVQRGEVLYSRRLKEILGYAENEINNAFEEWISRVHPEDLPHIMADMQAYFDGEIPSFVSEHRLLCKDGSWKWTLGRGMVVSRTADGKPLRMIGTLTDISERKQMEAELRELASTDYLTGLPNRRHFFTCIAAELARIQRIESQHAAVLMLDLDYFKRINDSYGHAIGDALLKHFATLMNDELRKIDTAGRIGGEEFAILLPGADAEAARVLAERLRQKVEETPLMLEGQAIPVTVSIGVAVLKPSDSSADAAIIRADKALYQAKESGRNRVELLD